MKTSLVVLILSLFHLSVAQDYSCTASVFGEALEARLRNIEKQLEVQVQGNQVAFGASIGVGDHVGPFNTEKTVVYKNVFINTGAYDPATGIFTAPMKGVYFFSFTSHTHSSKSMGLELRKNGVKTVVVVNHPDGVRWETATNSMSLQLEVGDQVSVSLSPNTWIYDNDSNVSTFIGHVLFPL